MIERFGTAPYAPASSVLDVIMARRKDPTLRYFDNEALEKLGIRESLVPRTAQALRLLDLLTDDGFVTPTFEGLISAPPGDLPRALEKLIRRAYKPIFEDLDPTVASTNALEQAFALFQPPGQRSRMVSMFQGLMRAADMTSGDDSAAVRAAIAAANSAARSASKSAVSRAAAVATEGASRSVGKTTVNRSGRWSSEVQVPRVPNSSAAQHSLQLDSGGSVDITLDVDLFALSKSDRDFVMDLIDRITSYRANRPGSSRGR
ncbi:DUF5343 domain-containing protein [Curtobacterium flaccumfaciens]|uniref:DUF5343 domain-containing protein n=1 Tax=Curtobacterium flaccumfaciens TaxID=2035 RepID=UPI001BDF58F9|nr:DUF5343 domain-containing protein [Curtobacterium flaccumfaciens]MBT1605309.1 DUF5343 domain-containing protein [Curtobacterium flaccumfaciens pv. betae]MBT1655582.1 DUF5343 domain-containing protein [Curtobacterium flaccumfaciens pv. betae]MCS0470467.1 DUF5343 domain-containing protein [Curtobacterium flaccumfaciens pv. betae]MCS0473831.1 DUF5343 domain-containing protein [Curtobacterium flaccumfaciens pv. betae]MCS0478664.1 DUF5343 domain-containing protein [Curtobacterium flaccumfaciens 